MKVINTVVKLAGSRSQDVDFEKLAITRDPAGPFKETEVLEIEPGPDNRDITVRAVEDTHVSVIHSVVNAAGVEASAASKNKTSNKARALIFFTQPFF